MEASHKSKKPSNRSFAYFRGITTVAPMNAVKASAIAYNERAGTLKQEDPAYLYNKAFFDESAAE